MKSDGRPVLGEECWGYRREVSRDSAVPASYVGWNPAGDRAFARFTEDPSNLYWARRLCETFEIDGVPLARVRAYAKAVAAICSAEPEWPIERWYLGLAYELRLDGRHPDIISSIDRKIRIKDRSQAAYVRGKLWAAGMSGAVHLDEVAEKALVYLRKVREEDRLRDWIESYWAAASWVDYPSVRGRHGEYIGGACSEGEHREQAFRVVLSAALRNEDWPTYDEVRQWYDGATRRQTRRDRATLAALDAWRALAVGDLSRVTTSLQILSQMPEQWEEALEVVRTLVKKRLLLDECRQWAEEEMVSAIHQTDKATITRVLAKAEAAAGEP